MANDSGSNATFVSNYFSPKDGNTQTQHACTVATNLNRPRRIFDRVAGATNRELNFISPLASAEGHSLTQQPPPLRIRLTIVSVALAIVVVGLLNAPWN